MAIAALDGPAATRAVEAAPFRAHVRHLFATASITPEALGLMAGVSPRMIGRLAGPSREPARIPPDVARRLLSVTPTGVTELAGRHVPAAPVTRQLRVLQSSGWSPGRLGETFGIEPWLVEALLDGAVVTCSRLVELQVSGGMLALRSGPAHVAA